VQSLIRY